MQKLPNIGVTFVGKIVGQDLSKIAQCGANKFYALQIFKHSDWLKNLSSQSECLKISVV